MSLDFIKQNKATILSLVSVIGVIATSIFSAKAAANLAKSEPNKKDKKEFIKTCAKEYAPAIITGVTTIACIVCADTTNRKQKISLTALCAAAVGQYSRYKNKVIDIFGKDAHDKIMKELTVEKAKKTHLSSPSIVGESSLEINDGLETKRLFYDSFSERYFESTIDRVLQAEYHLNRNFALGGYVPLDDFYKFLGLEPYSKAYPSDFEYGWAASMGYAWIDFNHTKCILDGGLECYIIDMIFEPVDDYLDL